MKTVFSTLLIIFTLVGLKPVDALAQQKNPGIDFFTGTWDEALEEANKQDKPIFVDAYATWCGPCKWMSANVFTNEQVAEFYNKNFINVKLDMEKGEGVLFSRQHQVTAYPTLLYFNSEGKKVHREMGMKRNQQFVEIGKKVLNKISN